MATAGTVLALLGFAATGAAQAPAAAGEPKRYVALGDSFAAGPLIPEQQRTDPLGCGRSTQNYPALVATALGVVDYTDVTCSGARTDHMTASQQAPLSGGGINPPQFDALRPDTDLVTVTIGGNDFGLDDIFNTCFALSSTDPLGDPCRRQATAGGSDRYAQRIPAVAPKVAEVLKGVGQRSPNATVLVVGYLRILPPAVGCYPIVPIAQGDVSYLDGLEQQLTAMLADQANDHGAVFVGSYAASADRDVCQPPEVKWVEGTTPTSPAHPMHPNVRGMHAVASLALDTLRKGG